MYDYFMKKLHNRAFKYKTVVAVDIADESLLGNLQDEFSGKIDLCIDHHISNKEYVYEMSGMGRKMKCIFLCMTISGLGLMGVPGFAGFISKWSLTTAAVESGNALAIAANLSGVPLIISGESGSPFPLK